MPSTFSTNLKIELMSTGENSGTWGTVTNTNLGTALEQAVVGYGNPNYSSDANLTITLTDSNAAQAARALVLNVTSGVSLTGTRELVVPTIQKQYIVQNNTTGSQSITVKTSAGTGVTIPNGKKMHVYVDGTNVVQMDDFALIFNVDNLTLDGNTLSSTDTNGNIVIAPNGTGDVQLDADTVRIGDSNANVTLTTNGTSDLILNTNAGTNSGSITIEDGVNGNIIIAPNGTGQVQITNAALDLTTIEVSNINAKDGTAAITIADSTGAVGISTAVTMSATTQNIALGTSQTTGTWTAGGASQTGALTLDQSTKTHTLNLGTGATESGLTKTINLGTGGVATSTTAINIGSANGTTTTVSGAFVANGGAVFNENGADVDFRVESDTDTHCLFVDASANNVGIGTSSPLARLHSNNSSSGATALTAIFGNGAAAALNNGSAIFLNNSSSFNGSTYSARIASVITNGSTQASDLIFGLYNGSQNNDLMRLDSSGNLGLGVTPSAWPSTYDVFQFGYSTNRASALFTNGVDDTWLVSNAYFNGTDWVKFATGTASAYEMYGGAHKWYYNATSGTGTFTFTQAMTLDASGNLGVGGTSPFARVAAYVSSSGTFQNAIGATNSVDSDLTVRIKTSITDFYNSAGSFTFSTGGSGGTERARITSGGDLYVGTTTNFGRLSVQTDGTNGSVGFVRNTDNTFTTALDFVKSRGSSVSPTAVQNGDDLYTLRVVPYQGSAYTYLTSQLVQVDGTFTSGQNPPTRHVWYTNVANGSPTERARITSDGLVQVSSGGSVQIGGTAARATTAGTNRLDIFNGTAPVGTLSNGISIYSSSGEAYVMDAAGNATLFSPHDAETNEWIFKSKHTPTGKTLKIDVEKLLRFINDHFGLDAVHEFIEE